MAENSSDSDSSSSCGWTVISREGSDVEAVASEGEGPGGPAEEPVPEELPPLLQESDQREEPALDVQAEFGQGDVSSSAADQSPSETPPAAREEEGKRPLPEDGACLGALSDDSDIVTLEAPKVEGTGGQGGALEAPADEGTPASEDSPMGSSFSSQYTFCQPEAAFPPPPPPHESSSDEGAPHSSPALRRRRAKKRPLSISESEDAVPPPLPPYEQEEEPEPETPSRRPPFGSGLNRCILLALLVAVSMGFGHFYGILEGTIQIQSRQQLVEKTHLDELKDVKEDLVHCQQEQGGQAGCQPLQEGLAACLLATEAEKKAFESQRWLLASENLRLRESLEKEEAALASLQEELRRLRERIRLLEEEQEKEEGGQGPEAPSGKQRLKAHLEEQQRRAQGFVRQKEVLLAEAQMLRRELDKERRAALALREEVERMSAAPEAPEREAEAQETERLKGRLADLEKRLRFEEQRSDLWEKLYVEAKGQAQQQPPPPPLEPKDRPKAKKKPPKASFFGSVKETFDAMKNSTKAFVRHHKEKIKRAKEAVKENLRRFSDSVKSTFRHFKDSTRTAFEEKRRPGKERREARKGRAGGPSGGCHEAPQQHQHQQAPGSQGEPGEGKKPRHAPACPGAAGCERKAPPPPKGCLGIFDCARQEFAGLFDQVLGPIRADEFHQLMHKFLQQEVGSFRHWRELEAFLGRFFRNGVFIHDQMLFADFVNDVKDYLEDMEEYRRGGGSGAGAFGDLDTYIYQYYFHYEPAPGHHGDSRAAKKFPSPPRERHLPKAHHPHHYPRQKREGGRWQKEGRHTANLEIEVGQMPFHPKY